MTFRVDTAPRGPQIFINCEGHLDAEAFAAIERGWVAAEAAGLRAVIRVCRGATADRAIVARLARGTARGVRADGGIGWSVPGSG